MQDSLFEGQLIRLAALDPDRDAQVEATWTQNAEYLRLQGAEPARPLSPAQVRRKYDQMGSATYGKPYFHFTIRTRADDRMIGFVTLHWIEWTHGKANLRMGIGLESDRGRGFGTEALQLVLRYAFQELNLYRVTVWTSDYNPRAVRFFRRAGFVLEVRRREALHRDGIRYDDLVLGLLRDEWRGTGT